MRRSAVFGALLGGCVFPTVVTPARANDPAAAESLFVEAQRLLAAGNAAAACPKLEESQRLDPTGATALSLARCLEQIGKTASAWASYQEALAFARKKGAIAREKEIEGRLAAIAPDVPKLTVTVPPEVAKLRGLRITRGDVAMGEGQWGSPLAVDPGPLVLVATATGRRSWTSELTIEKGRSVQVTVPLLEVEPAANAPGTASPTPSASVSPPGPTIPPASASPSQTPAASPAAPERTWGYVATGVGVAFAATGGYFVWRRATYTDDAERLCGSSTCGADNHTRALDKSREAGRAGTFALASFGASALGLGLGVYLLARPAPRVSVVPSVDARVAGATLSGAF